MFILIFFKSITILILLYLTITGITISFKCVHQNIGNSYHWTVILHVILVCFFLSVFKVS